jgi:hypothetical protein
MWEKNVQYSVGDCSWLSEYTRLVYMIVWSLFHMNLHIVKPSNTNVLNCNVFSNLMFIVTDLRQEHSRVMLVRINSCSMILW